MKRRRIQEYVAYGSLWFEQELKHLHIALELLRQYEKKDWQEVIPDAEFPAPLVSGEQLLSMSGVCLAVR